MVLDATKMLVEDKRIPNIHVLMVGEGPDKEMLVTQIADLGLQVACSLINGPC